MSCKVGLLLIFFQGCSGQMPTLHPETVVGWLAAPRKQRGCDTELLRPCEFSWLCGEQIATLGGASPIQLYCLIHLLELRVGEQE